MTERQLRAWIVAEAATLAIETPIEEIKELITDKFSDQPIEIVQDVVTNLEVEVANLMEGTNV